MTTTNRRKNYTYGVAWIARNAGNDEDDCRLDAGIVSQMIAVQLLADLWSKDPREVACDVIKARFQIADAEPT